MCSEFSTPGDCLVVFTFALITGFVAAATVLASCDCCIAHTRDSSPLASRSYTLSVESAREVREDPSTELLHNSGSSSNDSIDKEDSADKVTGEAWPHTWAAMYLS